MKKILIVGITSLEYLPYSHNYLKTLDNCDINFVYWMKRDGQVWQTPYPNVKYVVYDRQPAPGKLNKLRAYYDYTRFVKKLIKKEKYDFIIVLTSVPAVFLASTLLTKYRGRYIYDYRDYTHEKNFLYRRIVAALVRASRATLVSSEGFFRFIPRLPKTDVIHNIDPQCEYQKRFIGDLRSEPPYRIRFWGLIRDFSVNCRIVDALADDMRFELHYHGSESGRVTDLQDYITRRGAKNVFYHGHYTPEEKPSFAEGTDILHDIYDNNLGKNYMRYAMTNKFYDGVFGSIPQICMAGSLVGELAEQNGVGKALDPFSETFADELYTYISGLDRAKFLENCASYSTRLKAENDKIDIKDLIK